MPSRVSNIVVKVWKLVGFGSSITGFICFALGPSFQKLLGPWNLLKIVVYCILSSMFPLFILYADHLRKRFPRGFLLKALVSFLVLLFTSLYSYYDDLAGNKDGETEGKGHRNILSLISFGSFALMSMSLSIQLQPGFEVGLSNFFLACLVLGVLKKNLLEGLGVALLCFIVKSIHSYTDFRLEQHRRGDDEPEEITVVGDGLLGETPENSFVLPPPTVHPSDSTSIHSHTDFRQEQPRRGDDELEEITDVGDGLLGETPENSFLLPPPTVHPSDSTLRHRTVLNTPEDIVIDVGRELERLEIEIDKVFLQPCLSWHEEIHNLDVMDELCRRRDELRKIQKI